MPPPTPLHVRTQLLLSTQLQYLTHLRLTTNHTHRLASTTTPPKPTPFTPKITTPTTPTPLPLPQRDHTPLPLTRPLGQAHPPSPGDNSGIDTRPLTQRRDDAFNYDKHLARRRELTSAISRPYFRDMSALDRVHKGKTFVAPSRLLRADAARYFPNLRGYTLVDAWKADQDTCVAMKGRVSLVSVFSGLWAEGQAKSWVGGEMERLLGEGGGLQRVEITVEETSLRAALLWSFCGGLKRARREEEWGRFFVIRRGFGEQVRADLGVVNGKVGYVYLVDWEGRIRWAGSGDCEEGERQGLVNGTRRLLEQWREEMGMEMKRAAEVRKVVDNVEQKDEKVRGQDASKEVKKSVTRPA